MIVLDVGGLDPDSYFFPKDRQHLLLGVIEVGLGFETKGGNALSVIHLSSLILGENAAGVLLKHVDGDENLPLRLVLRNASVL